MATHTLIRALRANKPAFGAWLSTPGFLHARIVAQASPHMSWIAVDCEHGLISLNPGASESIAAIHGLPKVGPSAVVRIPATGVSDSTSWQIKYALDAGARGVIVPMVSLSVSSHSLLSEHIFHRYQPQIKPERWWRIADSPQLADVASGVRLRMIIGELLRRSTWKPQTKISRSWCKSKQKKA